MFSHDLMLCVGVDAPLSHHILGPGVLKMHNVWWMPSSCVVLLAQHWLGCVVCGGRCPSLTSYIGHRGFANVWCVGADAFLSLFFLAQLWLCCTVCGGGCPPLALYIGLRGFENGGCVMADASLSHCFLMAQHWLYCTVCGGRHARYVFLQDLD